MASDSDDLADLPPSGLTVKKKDPTTTLQDVTNKNEAAKQQSTPAKAATDALKAPPVATVTPKMTPKAAPPTVPDNLLEGFIKYGHCDYLGAISSTEAKKDYFLTPDDIRSLPYQSWGGGIGCGAPRKLYKHQDLIAVAMRKYGRNGLRLKLEGRYKREAKKREREEQAEAALEQARKKHKASTTTQEGDTKEIKQLRASLLRQAKKHMGFEMSGSPKNWRFEVPGTTAGTFCALMGRPTDTTLSTFVKKGAYYSVQHHDTGEFFGCDESKLFKNFSREGVSQKIGEAVIVRFKPSSNELSVSGWAEISGCCW
jgi:hypothetical protein